MRYLPLLLLTIGCHKAVPSEPLEEVEPSMALISRWGFAHACPVDGMVFTAAHVSERLFPTGAKAGTFHNYQQGPRTGLLQSFIASNAEDLALLQLIGGDEPYWFHRYEGEIALGDPIYWFEYEYSPLRRNVRRDGRVSGLAANHVQFEPRKLHTRPIEGSSGGCIFAANGDVIGVVSWIVDERYGFGPMIPRQVPQ